MSMAFWMSSLSAASKATVMSLYLAIASLKPFTRFTWLGAARDPIRMPTEPFPPIFLAMTSPDLKPSS